MYSFAQIFPSLAVGCSLGCPLYPFYIIHHCGFLNFYDHYLSFWHCKMFQAHLANFFPQFQIQLFLQEALVPLTKELYYKPRSGRQVSRELISSVKYFFQIFLITKLKIKVQFLFINCICINNIFHNYFIILDLYNFYLLPIYLKQIPQQGKKHQRPLTFKGNFFSYIRAYSALGYSPGVMILDHVPVTCAFIPQIMGSCLWPLWTLQPITLNQTQENTDNSIESNPIIISIQNLCLILLHSFFFYKNIAQISQEIAQGTYLKQIRAKFK